MKKRTKEEVIKTLKSEEKFEKIISSIVGYSVRGEKLEIDWTTGGMTGGSCWGDDANQAVEAEPEPEFSDLDKVLEVLCPNISFLQYKKLCAEVVERDSDTNHEYYGNYYYKGIKRVHLKKLKSFLEENKLWTEK